MRPVLQTESSLMEKAQVHLLLQTESVPTEEAQMHVFA